MMVGLQKVEVLSLYVVKLMVQSGSIPSTTYGPMTTSKSDPCVQSYTVCVPHLQNKNQL